MDELLKHARPMCDSSQRWDRLPTLLRVWDRLPAGLLPTLLIAAFALTGCNQPPAVNPWRDDSIPPSEYGTASSELVLSTNTEPAVRVRDYPEMLAPVARYQVPHYPLWWEDPFEDQGDKNCSFAWTWQDYFDLAYSPARFAADTLAWPVSAIVTPPGTPMVSDGVVDNTFDSRRGVSPNPTAGPEDFIGMAEADVAVPFDDTAGAKVRPAPAPQSAPDGL